MSMDGSASCDDRDEEDTDILTATTHFNTLFPDYRIGFAILMFIPEGGGTPIHCPIPLDNAGASKVFWKTVKPYMANHDCYISPATFAHDSLINEQTNKPEYRTKRMIAECSWAFLDRDRNELNDSLPTPTLTVETSAGSFQDYWHLDSGVDVETIEDLNRRIASVCGCGFQAIDAPHVFRIVGTRNFKAKNNREIVRLVEQSDAVYALSDFDHLPAVPVAAPVRRYPSGGEREWVHAPTEADKALMKKALRAKNGAKIRKLSNGDISDYEDDYSRADLAFCCLLAYWTDCNEEQMDRIYCRSRLHRDKWERDDYRQSTIAKAIAWVEEGRIMDGEGEDDSSEECPTPPTMADYENVAAFDEAWRSSEPVVVEGVGLIRLSDVTPEKITWLWKGFIPLGKLSVLDGDPGLGKSTVTLDLAARVTRGMPMPDGTESDLDGPASVVLLSAEDGLADTIQPRLLAAEGDPSRVFAIETVGTGDETRMPSLADYTRLEQTIIASGAKLVIVDPLMAYLPSTTNAHRDQDIRRVMAPLKEVAERTGAAILVVRHLNKGMSANVLYRGGGSIGIIGAVRSGLIVAPDPQDETGARRILAVQKMNVAARAGSLAFHVEDNGAGDARIAWIGPSSQTAASLFAPIEDTGGGQMGEAKAFLREALSDGPVAANEIKQLAVMSGVSSRTLERAKKNLGVTSIKQGFEGGFVWSLPSHEDCQLDPRPPNDTEDRQLPEGGDEWQSAA